MVESQYTAPKREKQTGRKHHEWGLVGYANIEGLDRPGDTEGYAAPDIIFCEVETCGKFAYIFDEYEEGKYQPLMSYAALLKRFPNFKDFVDGGGG